MTDAVCRDGVKRADQRFVAVNLAAVPEALIESELFGHKRGAFTDARADKAGLFSEANKGTIFLDEIGELSPSVQAKLLRALQEKEIRPVGSTKVETIDVRVVAATNRDLESMMQDGTFREDLYYRLNVVQLDIPPLRHRQDDIIPLANHFLAKSSTDGGLSLSKDAQRALLAYSWPGNVRELENAIERGITLSTGDTVTLEELPAQVRERKHTDFLSEAVTRGLSLADLEREFILLVLADEGGNKTRAAKRLGLDRKTLYRKLDEYQRATPDETP